jgi:hypothetical protein
MQIVAEQRGEGIFGREPTQLASSGEDPAVTQVDAEDHFDATQPLADVGQRRDAVKCLGSDDHRIGSEVQQTRRAVSVAGPGVEHHAGRAGQRSDDRMRWSSGLDGVEIGDVQLREPQAAVESPRNFFGLGTRREYAAQRLVAVARTGDGVNRRAMLEIDDGNDAHRVV